MGKPLLGHRSTMVVPLQNHSGIHNSGKPLLGQGRGGGGGVSVPGVPRPSFTHKKCKVDILCTWCVYAVLNCAVHQRQLLRHSKSNSKFEG